MSEDEASAVGLRNNPGYRELLADLQIARADIIEAAQVTNPDIISLLPIGPQSIRTNVIVVYVVWDRESISGGSFAKRLGTLPVTYLTWGHRLEKLFRRWPPHVAFDHLSSSRNR